MKKKTSTFNNSLIWFGAGVSIAEILTGTYLAPLGFGKGILAILVGHVIGCILLFLAGLMGGRTGKSSMETAGISFGRLGAAFFAIVNVLQLVGWTGIMIYDGALAAENIWNIGSWIWSVVIGVLILVWILIGIENLGKVNVVAMALLFGLTVVLSIVIFKDGGAAAEVSDEMSFGAGVELSVAMPLSWFPLISDYTREAEKPFGATFGDNGEGRAGCRRTAHHRFFHGNDHISGCLFRRRQRGEYPQEAEDEAGCHPRDGHRDPGRRFPGYG